jgi:NAD(P)H dehydrogenase (quinone)
MRVLVVYTHPLETSFLSALHARVVETLRASASGRRPGSLRRKIRSGNVPADLYPLPRFEHQPGASRRLRRSFAGRGGPGPHLTDLARWLPAILKGFFDCVFLPGVSFTMENGHFSPALHDIKLLAAICSYGASRARTVAMGNPQYLFIKRNLGAQISPLGRTDFLGLYDLDAATPGIRARYRRRVARALQHMVKARKRPRKSDRRQFVAMARLRL